MRNLMSLAAGLVGVVVLAAAARAGCLPEQDGGYVKARFARTPGVGDFNNHPAVDLDGALLRGGLGMEAAGRCATFTFRTVFSEKGTVSCRSCRPRFVV